MARSSLSMQQGRPSFQALQHRGTHPTHTIVFYAFDLLHLNGEDTTACHWRRVARSLLESIEKSGLLLSLQLPGSVADIVSTVRAMQLEGIVAKRKDSRYEAGERSGNLAEAEARAPTGICHRRLSTVR